MIILRKRQSRKTDASGRSELTARTDRRPRGAVPLRASGRREMFCRATITPSVADRINVCYLMAVYIRLLCSPVCMRSHVP